MRTVLLVAKLSSHNRASMPKGEFALPSGTKVSSKPAFPIEDRTHQEAALRDVGRALKAGDITSAQAAEVRAKAESALHKGHHPRDGHVDGSSGH